MASTLQPGLIALHGNRTETLAETVFSWLRAHPLGPLEQEVVLVQSNGMAEWFKMGMAQSLGVCAAARVELPARFLWRSYRQVLGAAAVPRQSPLDKTALTWRLMRQLPECAAQGGYEAIAGFLSPGDAERLLQLAERLADLFDQYQIYRADWLDDWAAGRDVLATPGRPTLAVPEDQLWQPKLWRCILAELDDVERASTRPQLHRQVIAALESGEPLVQPLARRVVLFGMSHLPLSMLQTLAAMSRHSQILLAVPNPCRFHWADAIDGRELLRIQRRRQPLRNGRDLAALPLEMMHAHAHPLLSSWGRQARDYVRQLDAFETQLPEGMAAELPRIDIFDEDVDPDAPLLSQVQQAIRDMVPLTEHAHAAIARADRSIVFHSAHSMVRELEVLHDQLLALLAEPAAPGGQALQPRDVVVMVPAIEGVAASIRAVFGQYGRHDARHIPFDIADLSASDNNPLVAALQWLLRLPQQRCRLSELRDLLDVPAVAARFGLDAEDLPQLSAWMAGAGIRWGLNAEQRGALGLAACGEQNSAWFGLHRMLLGFASGSGAWDLGAAGDATGIAQIEPYAEVGGLGAELAGQLATLLERLLDWWALAGSAADPAGWAQRFRQLLADFFAPQTDSDRALLSALDSALSSWLEACELGGFDGQVELIVAQQAWLDIVQQPSVDSRFRAGGVTFCTLMPMRAIPFEVVCLLGMNDGDYPRRAMRSDFDLMALPGQLRPGDRARRDDDRQLMLEALLSARRMLYISWAGRSVRDNSEQPPSVLVSQLRDYLAAGWKGEEGDLLAQRTFHHPLQPFSRRYFSPDSTLRTYAREWRAAHLLRADDPATAVPALAAFVPDIKVPLTLSQLHGFVRHPAQAFFRQRLNVRFEKETELSFDEEAFGLQGLAGYSVIEQLQTQVVADIEAAPTIGIPLEQRVAGHLARIERAGTLPLAGLGTRKRAELQEAVLPSLQSWLAHRNRFDRPVQRQRLHFAQDGLVFEDWLDDLRIPDRDGEAVPAWISLQARTLLGTRGEVRPASVLLPYLRSLVAAACGVQVQGIVVARDATLALAPMQPGEAMAQFQTLLQVWQAGQDSPLPLPLKTGLAAAAAGEDLARAETAYEGDGFAQAGEADDACWARLFPDFDALVDDGRFAPLAEAVHAPLLAWLVDQVQVLEPGTLAPVIYLLPLEQA
ncbi:exodeoxyribonuclease V subunit gamma [Acidovorax sp. CCYZU-2555]|uniref:exodeoxyribonuclease V subunit gamma n=1 Tax=Acidovorax sp. CCYZU-2555 TaxID=2835042 RepID=UPI001BCEA552|nr:exodeoxyribonuclease V subunit gamma [Acidovorax sp. CCYZU-2555]MBS7780980.1 exodeoxyribonuclease V subunit gamma [Acidovorax sp. CCYZU-2555]